MIEKCNKAAKQWEHVVDCDQNRGCCAVALVDSKVFLFGGVHHKTTFDFFDLKVQEVGIKDQG